MCTKGLLVVVPRASARSDWWHTRHTRHTRHIAVCRHPGHPQGCCCVSRPAPADDGAAAAAAAVARARIGVQAPHQARERVFRGRRCRAAVAGSGGACEPTWCWWGQAGRSQEATDVCARRLPETRHSSRCICAAASQRRLSRPQRAAAVVERMWWVVCMCVALTSLARCGGRQAWV
jgi:hypothetical protein